MMMNEYSHKEIELAAQSEWEKRDLFSTVEDGPKYYPAVSMFPYPSGKLHMGMFEIIQLVMSYQGLNVLRDLMCCSRWVGTPLVFLQKMLRFKNKTHPLKWTDKNIASMKNQLQRLRLQL